MKIPFFGKDKPSAESTAPQVKPQVQSVRIFNTIEQEGYYCYSAEHFLQSNEFLPLINKISSALGGRKEVFERYLLPSIKEVATFAQKIPASEVKDGKERQIERKIFPGYVLVHMIKNDVTWYVVRNTRGVTGFVGPGSEPVPLSDAEMARLGVKMSEIKIDVEIGDRIKVISGPWAGSEGGIKTINRTKQTVTMDIDLFGRSTDVEINLAEIQKLK